MYRIVAYHGRGNENEVANDLRLLWDGLRYFAKARHISHIYCFQKVVSLHGAGPSVIARRPTCPERSRGKADEVISLNTVDLLLLVQYEDNVAAKLGYCSSESAGGGRVENHASQTHNHMDYCFYIRGGNLK